MTTTKYTSLHRYASLFILVMLLPLLSIAQKATLINSTSNRWSGGIAGRYGTGYQFVVEFSHYGNQEPEPDTLWIGNKCILVVMKSAPGVSYNLIRTAGKKKVTFQVWGGTSNEDEERPGIHYPGSPAEKKVVKPTPPIKCGGVALLSYKYKGKENYFVIEKIMTFGKPANYP